MALQEVMGITAPVAVVAVAVADNIALFALTVPVTAAAVEVVLDVLELAEVVVLQAVELLVYYSLIQQEFKLVIAQLQVAAEVTAARDLTVEPVAQVLLVA